MSVSVLNKIYRTPLTLLTDLYQLTMAYGYWKTGQYNKEAVFHLYYRKNPFGGSYAISCGLALVIDFLQNLRFEPEDIHYLGTLKGNDGYPLFDEGFLNYLQRLEFSCDVDAIPEGTAVFPHIPLIRVKGPLLQAQLIETALLNIVNFSTLIATKASRITQAAQGDRVLEFGLRRAQGVDGALTASRSAYIGGCHSTSNVLAGKLFNIPVSGTHAHSWVMSFDDELESFKAYAKALPANCVFLVDTYNTLEGTKKAINVGLALQKEGYQMIGIRLDSGNLGELSKQARILLDEAGLKEAKIVASNDLDEFKIKQLKEEGAPIKVWGVGTRLATAYDQPALGGVYKLAALKEGDQWKHKIKYSEDSIKKSITGILTVKRFFDPLGKPVGDMLIDELTPIEGGLFMTKIPISQAWIHRKEYTDQMLTVPVFRNGKCCYTLPTIQESRALAQQQIRLFSNMDYNYFVGLEGNLHYKWSNMQNARYLQRK